MTADQIKPGVTVRVLRNAVGAHRPVDPYILLQPGDTFVLSPNDCLSSDSVNLQYLVRDEDDWYNFICLEDVEVVVITCTCSINVLMATGCRCGGT